MIHVISIHGHLTLDIRDIKELEFLKARDLEIINHKNSFSGILLLRGQEGLEVDEKLTTWHLSSLSSLSSGG